MMHIKDIYEYLCNRSIRVQFSKLNEINIIKILTAYPLLLLLFLITAKRIRFLFD